jgi:hypothetical protein
MSRNLVGSIYGSFSIRLPHFITSGHKFVAMAILVSERKVKKSSPLKQEEQCTVTLYE